MKEGLNRGFCLNCIVTWKGVDWKIIVATHWYVVLGMKFRVVVTPEGEPSREISRREEQLGQELRVRVSGRLEPNTLT